MTRESTTMADGKELTVDTRTEDVWLQGVLTGIDYEEACDIIGVDA